MAVPWIKVATNLPQHPKIFALAEELGLNDKLLLPEAQAVCIVINLWVWAMQNQPDGNLGAISNRAIARVCGWQGKPDKLIDSLISCGFLDVDRYIHDWDEYTLSFNDTEEHRKAKNREYVARSREKRKQKNAPEDVRGCKDDVSLTTPLQEPCNVRGCKDDVRGLDKIREDKIREDKITSFDLKEKQEKEKLAPPTDDDVAKYGKAITRDEELLRRLKGQDAEFEAALERIGNSARGTV